MKVTNNLEEFYKLNDKDLTNILQKSFKNVLKYYSVEDLKSEIYLRLHKKKYIQNYRPFEISIDPEENTWFVRPAYAKFSTYICKFVYNYIFAYYNKVKPDELCLSLDEFNDSGYNEETSTHLEQSVEDNNPLPNLNLRIEIERALSLLEEKTKDNGTLICKKEILTAIAKMIDKQGGASEEHILKEISGGYIGKPVSRKNKECQTGLEKLLAEEVLKETTDNKILKKEQNGYVLDNPERRSLYNLFTYYLRGFKDKEISEEFQMTVAGIGALKRSLRKEIKKLEFFMR